MIPLGTGVRHGRIRGYRLLLSGWQGGPGGARFAAPESYPEEKKDWWPNEVRGYCQGSQASLVADGMLNCHSSACELVLVPLSGSEHQATLERKEPMFDIAAGSNSQNGNPSKINPEKVENFRAGKVTVNLPAFTSNPPQIHQRKTTFCTLFLPKPPAKTG